MTEQIATALLGLVLLPLVIAYYTLKFVAKVCIWIVAFVLWVLVFMIAWAEQAIFGFRRVDESLWVWLENRLDRYVAGRNRP